MYSANIKTISFINLNCFTVTWRGSWAHECDYDSEVIGTFESSGHDCGDICLATTGTYHAKLGHFAQKKIFFLNKMAYLIHLMLNVQ